MGAVTSAHPSDRALSSFALGKLDDKSAEAVSKHLGQCPDCRKRVAAVSADSFLGRIRGAQASGEHRFSRSQTSDAESWTTPETHAPPSANTLPPDLAEHPDYEIKRELGRGGMGVVYLVHNKLMGRDEVLKVVSGHLTNRPGVLDRFLREIRSAANLHHTNIVTAYSAFRAGESIVFAMEYVEGHDLAQLVKGNGPLPVAHACNFVYQAALGLQYAHEKGMVHRDIKPGNLILAREGNRPVVKVLDFGLAKMTSEGQRETNLTREGQMLGTPDYIAPEQIRDAQSADIRADIYSLGCTLYYLLTGGPPFRGDSPYDILQAHHSTDAEPLNLARPDVPVELAALVAKMMAKDPERRFQTPKEVAQALAPFFRKGDVALESPVAEVSQSAQSSSGRPVPVAVSPPTQPAMNEARPIARPEAMVDSPPPKTEWKSPIDVLERERSQETKQVAAGYRRPRWVWPSVGAGVLVLGLLVVSGVVIRIKTSNGTIELVGLPRDAEVFVDGERVDIILPAGGKHPLITAIAGTHKIVAKIDGVEIAGDEVTVEAGGKEPFIARHIPRDAARPSKPDADGRTSGSDVAKSTGPPRDRGAAPSSTAPPLIMGDADSRSRGAEAVKTKPDKEQTPPPVVEKGPEPKTEMPAPVVEPEFVITGTAQIKLRRIPAGKFMMGSPEGEGDVAEHPRHEVRITRSFYMGVTEVTQKQYCAVTGRNPSCFSGSGEGGEKVLGQSTERLPVESVSWLEAVRFCNWLSAKEGLKAFYETDGESVRVPTWEGGGYRLPTEAEWEYASGGDPEELDANAWFSRNSGGVTHPVRQKQANRCGLYDMLGNVWEWCWDSYDKNYYARSPVEDPRGPEALENPERAYRGGGLNGDPTSECRSAVRWRANPKDHTESLGFRVARNAGADVSHLSGNKTTDAPRLGNAKAGEDRGANARVERPIRTPSEKAARRAAVASGAARDLLPAGDSGQGAVTWAFTTNDPGPSWKEPDFNDGDWRHGQMGFGAGETHVTVRTNVTSNAIWLRAKVNVPAVAPTDTLILRQCGTGAPAVFVNGRLLSQYRGGIAYSNYTLGPSQRALLRPGGNIIAVSHSWSPDGPHGVDIGLKVSKGDKEAETSDGTFRPLFNGKDLDGWKCLPGYWRVQGDVIVGSPPSRGRPKHTFLAGSRSCRDFELRFKARITESRPGVGNSGVQIRSTLTTNQSEFNVRGFQCEIADPRDDAPPPGSVIMEPGVGEGREAPRRMVSEVYHEGDFNEFSIKCVGKHVTTMVNGFTMVDKDFPTIPDEGIIAWQLHGGLPPKEVVFKDVLIRELGARRSNDHH